MKAGDGVKEKGFLSGPLSKRNVTLPMECSHSPCSTETHRWKDLENRGEPDGKERSRDGETVGVSLAHSY